MFTNSGISSPQGLLEMSPSIHPCLSLAQSLITGWLLHPTSKGIQPPWHPALNWCKWAGPIVLLHLLPTYIWNLSICNVPFSSSPPKKESEILLTLFYVFWQFLFQKKTHPTTVPPSQPSEMPPSALAAWASPTLRRALSAFPATPFVSATSSKAPPAAARDRAAWRWELGKGPTPQRDRLRSKSTVENSKNHSKSMWNSKNCSKSMYHLSVVYPFWGILAM